MKGVDKSKLPVFFKANRNAWMTQSVFDEWLNDCFVPEVEDFVKEKNIYFKILLIVDNAP